MDNIQPHEVSNSFKNERHESNSFLKNIALNGPSLVAVVQISDLKIIFTNQAFSFYLGYTNTDLEEKDFFFTDLIEEYMIDRLLYQINTIKDDFSARSRYVIYELKSKSGAKAPFYIYIAPVKDENDLIDTYYHIVMHPDLSRWNMPFSSFNSRELFLEQFNSEDFGTFEWIIDVDKVFWSTGIYRIYEVDDTKRDINNLFASDFIHPNDKRMAVEAMDKALTTGEDINIEFKIVTVSNKVKVIHSLARVIKNKEGKPLKLVGSIRDISSQKSIEEDLKNKVAELNHTNRELEEFAYIASHDLQEPLRKITTFSDRLLEKYKGVLAGDGAMYLSRMIVSAENMRSLIDDLLEFSRISKTAQPFAPVNLNIVLRKVKTELELTIEETGTIIHSMPLPVIDAIDSQMKQLFMNIISNAIKFHKPGIAPVITIQTGIVKNNEVLTYELLQDMTYHKIEISDNGIGFEEEYALRIFQVFQRLHGKSEFPGTGIGLAICKKILEYHNGIIYAENVPGTGARFTFIIPQNQKPKLADA